MPERPPTAPSARPGRHRAVLGSAADTAGPMLTADGSWLRSGRCHRGWWRCHAWSAPTVRRPRSPGLCTGHGRAGAGRLARGHPRRAGGLRRRRGHRVRGAVTTTAGRVTGCTARTGGRASTCAAVWSRWPRGRWRTSGSGTWSGPSGSFRDGEKVAGSVAAGSVKGWRCGRRAGGSAVRLCPAVVSVRCVMVMCTTAPPGTAQDHARTTRCVGGGVRSSRPAAPAGLGVDGRHPSSKIPKPVMVSTRGAVPPPLIGWFPRPG